ncbi:MAG TPA: Calx-beta domain-containing protein [Pyrinomonadaceae bacterium]|nr:Calx-beta domain-containing protein [Pyrinomonadaceae bacterium]
MPIRYLTATCALTIVILGLLTLTFNTNAKRAFHVMQSPSSVNVALSSNGAVASASSVHFSGNYPVAAVNNGDRKAMNWGNGGGWNDNTHGDFSSDIVQINFPAFKFVSQINVFTLRDSFQDNQTPPTLTETFSTCENSGYGITEFEVQYWNGWMWVTVPGGLVRDNNKVWRQFTFPEVWASRVRVQVHGATRFTTTATNYSRIVEIEAYGRTAGFNLAAAANGAVASASSTVDTNFPVSAVNDGDRTGFNWGRGGFGSGWRDATENDYSIDWVRIDFAGGQTRRINEIDVYTLRDEFSTNPDDPTIFETFTTADDSGGYGITDYDVQYLSGGVWRNVPGGKVTNNDKIRRQFRFSPITTNAIRVAVHKGVNYTTPDSNWSRIVEIEAWENAAAPDDVVWVEDAIPAGATTNGTFEGWNWTCFNPLPLSGTLAHTSENVAGVHQHFFLSASQTLTVNAGDTLVAHIYLDPANPPTEVMLQWADDTWEHRAYWGADQLGGGVNGTVSRRPMGALPPTGQWVRLEVPASLVGLEGRTLTGMGFSLFNGRATWDHAGKYAGAAPVQPTISISDATVNEGNSGTTSAAFNVTLSSASSQTISVNYVTASNSATSSSDYVSASGTVTFTPGQTSKPITIQVVGDTAVESNENFLVNLSNPFNATLADSQGVGSILNDDALPPISDVVWVDDALPAGATPAGSSEGWNWTSINPSPLSGTLAHTSDIVPGVHQHYFFNATQTLTVNAGDTLIAHVYLDPANPPTAVMLQFNDGMWEHRAYWGANQFPWGVDGTISRRNMGTLPPTGQWVRLEVPASLVGLEGRTLNGMAFSLVNGRALWDRAGKYTGAAVIPTVSINDVRVSEGNSGTTSAVFTVTLSSASTQSIRVNYVTANGTANGPSDYVGASGTLTFTPGQISQPLPIQVLGDHVFEPDETFIVTLSNPVNATLADGQGVGTILNDDPQPSISINDVTVNEGSGTTSVVFNVTFSNASYQTISVNYATANGTASSPSDYVGASGTLTFTPGETSQLLPIQVIGDTVFEAQETFFVNLSNPVNATIADGQGVGTILNDDPQPSISINDVTVNEGNSGNTSAVFTVTLSNASAQSISVSYATANGTAISPSDYIAASGIVTFAPLQTSQQIPIPVVGDTAVETNEFFFVNIFAEINATLADGQGTGTIVNDDATLYEGWVDVADCDSIIGWAADRNRLNTSITVGIYDGDTPVTTLLASDLRSDVGAYLGDNGKHGFAIATPQQFKDGLPHTLRVRFESGTTELSASPRTISCPTQTTYYEIVARHSGKCLDVEGESMDSGARVIQFGCGGWTNQQWQVIPVGDGYYKIVARHSGKVLDVQGGGLDNGTPVWQWDENGTAAQQWAIIDIGGGYVRIMARHSGKALDVAGGSTADLTPIHQWDYVGIANQQWLLRLVP